MDLTPVIEAATAGQWSIVIDRLQHLPIERLDDRDPVQLEIKKRVLDLVLQVLERGDFEQQWQIAKIFPKLGEMAIQPLLDIVSDGELDVEDRWGAARILGGFDRPQVIAALIELIHANEDPELTEIATNALTNMGASAIEMVASMLSTPDSALPTLRERSIAVAMLARIRHSQTIEPLLGIVDDPDPQIRTLAVDALGSFHDPRIPTVLVTKLTDVAAGVRKAAVIALSLRGDLAIELNLLAQMQPLLFDLNIAVCEAAALGLARLPDPQVVEVLATVLMGIRTPDRLKSAIVLALGWIGSRAAIDSLVTALASASPELTIEIVRSIGKTESERNYATQSIVTYCRTSPSLPAIVKQEIAAILGNIGDLSTVSDLVLLLGDPNDRVKLYTIAAIAKLSPEIPTEIWQIAERYERLSPSDAELDSELRSGVRMLLSQWHDRGAICKGSMGETII